jgi:hypothetical protein
MSEFVSVEWFGRDSKIGIVLTYDQFDGFKARMAPLPKAYPADNYRNEEQDIKWLVENAAKIPFEWAWGIFNVWMSILWANRQLPSTHIRYDGVNYTVNVYTIKEVEK